MSAAGETTAGPRGSAADGRSYGTASAWRPGALSDALEAERHRWFLWLPVLIAVGIGCYFAAAEEPDMRVALLATALAAAIAALLRRGTLLPVAARILLAIAIGFAVAKARTEWVRAPVLAGPIQNAELRGFVEFVEPQTGRGHRLTIAVSSITGLAPQQTPRRVRVRTSAGGEAVKPGDGVLIAARLSPPPEPVLPGGYDFGRRAWYLGIGGVGYALRPVRPDPAIGLPPWHLQAGAAVERVRVAIGRAVVAALPGQAGAIANALLTGERGGITPETEKAFRDSGLYHVLSISGLHMTVMAGTLFLASRLLLAAIPGVAVRFPIKVWAAGIAALGALGYLLISGAAFATLRSYVMISIVFLAIAVERPALAMRTIALAALGLLLVWPESLLDPGFQMSFAAVTALIAVLEAWRDHQERLGRDRAGPRGPLATTVLFLSGIVASTLIAGTAVAPLAAYHFHTSQQYSVIGNVLALPICDLVVMPALLATLVVMPFGLEAYPLALAGYGIDTMTAIASWVASLPGAVALIPAIPLEALLAFVAGGLWLLLWQGRWRFAGLAALAAGLLLAPTREQPDVLVSRDGTLVAARTDGERLAAAPGANRLFELSRWLEADGDRRTAAEASAGRGFACDSIGCTAVIGAGRGAGGVAAGDGASGGGVGAGGPGSRPTRLAIVRHRAGFADDCARAAIVVTNGPPPRFCSGPYVVIDRRKLRAAGVHAIYVRHGRYRVETVAETRGKRPWSTPQARQSHLDATQRQPTPARAQTPGANLDEEDTAGEDARADD